MKRKFIYIGIMGVFFGCEEPQLTIEPEKPDVLLPEPDLIPIIIDLQVLESHYHQKYQRPDAYKYALDSASYFVFEKHNTSREVFRESYEYYSHDIDKMFLLYEATLDTLNTSISSQP